jgi:hypothetical protein
MAFNSRLSPAPYPDGLPQILVTLPRCSARDGVFPLPPRMFPFKTLKSMIEDRAR